ncbi:methyl-accepting chemotaxis protein [Thiocystis violacea]|uniref:methyl-accepting chemotaxis protein n=1 Tax=Thiocystis violacea TaxID=13725 RepID=UPI001907F8E6|nr:methyl-accepting chemotaxis protein [Thiocystis violacea]MBK1720712.1 chemotaxis protein [Thiocystis violacea]
MRLSMIHLVLGISTALGASTIAHLTVQDTLPAALGDLALGTLVGVMSWLSSRRLIVAPLADLTATIRDMRRDGDLSRRATGSAGPIGDCAAQFNALIENFQGIIGKIIFDAERLATAADSLAAHARDVAEGSQAQRQASSRLVDTIEQMRYGVDEVASHAANTAANAQSARDLSQDGSKAVANASEEIDRIAVSVQASAQVIAALGQRSQAIGGIVQVIQEIAEQTNLLALNAAIEAARAGEQGRGFAVVADEVRNLAKRTASATSEIGGMISAIQGETRSAIASINVGSEQAGAGAALARQTAGALEHIKQGAEQTLTLIDGIAAAMTQQSLEAERVVTHVHDIMTMVDRNANGAAETLREAQALESLSANLHEISNVFQLGSSGQRAVAAHQRMTEVAPTTAGALGRVLEQAIAAHEIEEDALFDLTYTPIPGTAPQKFSSRFDQLTDRLFPPVQEPILSRHDEAVYVIGCDRNGYVPTHNACFCQPLTGDPAHDLAHNRTKRVFDDPVGKRCGAHRLSFLIQTYRRDTGEIMHDISAPVFVNGRHWGGCRIGYRA